jgi:hypothetical protein
LEGRTVRRAFPTSGRGPHHGRRRIIVAVDWDRARDLVNAITIGSPSHHRTRFYGRAAAMRLTASGSSRSFSQAKLNRANGLG